MLLSMDLDTNSSVELNIVKPAIRMLMKMRMSRCDLVKDIQYVFFVVYGEAFITTELH